MLLLHVEGMQAKFNISSVKADNYDTRNVELISDSVKLSGQFPSAFVDFLKGYNIDVSIIPQNFHETGTTYAMVMSCKVILQSENKCLFSCGGYTFVVENYDMGKVSDKTMYVCFSDSYQPTKKRVRRYASKVDI